MTDPYIGQHYSEDLTSGFLVEVRNRFIPRNAPKDSVGVEVESLSFWYGPNHGWGTTTGPLDSSVRVWDSKTKVELALKRSPGRPRRTKIVDLTTARIDEARYRVEVTQRAFDLAQSRYEAAVEKLFDLERLKVVR
jgi:hypothetical protein